MSYYGSTGGGGSRGGYGGGGGGYGGGGSYGGGTFLDPKMTTFSSSCLFSRPPIIIGPKEAGTGEVVATEAADMAVAEEVMAVAEDSGAEAADVSFTDPDL